MGLGSALTRLDLNDIRNFEDLVQIISDATKDKQPGEWILGFGWHQNKLNNETEVLIKGFPTHHRISKVSPNNPVYLSHKSGHAGFANTYAMKIAGISSGTKFNFDSNFDMD